jgi:hypothetical protein
VAARAARHSEIQSEEDTVMAHNLQELDKALRALVTD